MKIPQPVIEMVPIGNLVPWARNPRKNHAVDAIVKSMESFGYAQPICVQKGTMRVLAGHGRLMALKKSGVVEVPVIVLDLDDAKADLFTLTDNRLSESSEWDFPAMAGLLKEFDAKGIDAGIAGFNEEEIRQAATLNLEDLEAAMRGAKNSPIYTNAGGEVAGHDTSLLVVFSSEEELELARSEIKRLQGASDKTVGDVIYELLRDHARG